MAFKYEENESFPVAVEESRSRQVRHQTSTAPPSREEVSQTDVPPIRPSKFLGTTPHVLRLLYPDPNHFSIPDRVWG